MTGLVITFASTHDALYAETVFRKEGISGRIIPTPPDIFAECGLSWRAEPSEKQKIVALRNMVRYSKIHLHEFRF